MIWRDRVAGLAIPAATLLGLAATLRHLGPVVLQPDSPTYLGWAAFRSIGYPLFLSGVEASFGLAALPVIQALLFFVALLALGRSLVGTFGSRALAGAVVLAIGLNPELAKYHALVLTESLSMTLTVLAFALLADYLRTARAVLLVACAVLVGAAASVRPSLGVLVWVPVAAALLRGVPRWRHVAIAVLALAIVVGATGIVDRIRLARAGGPANEILAQTLIGKVAPLIDEGIQSAHPGFARSLAEAAAPLRRIEQEFPSWDLVYMARGPFYDHARFVVVPAVLAEERVPAAEVPAVELTLARETIAQRPLGYLRDCAINFYALWTLPDLKLPGAAAAAARVADELEAGYGVRIETPARPVVVALAVRVCLAAVFLGGLWFALRFLARSGREDPATILGGLAFLAVLTVFGATAALQAGLPRYALACWPLQMVVLGAAASAALSGLRRRQRP
jgi:hypothetical protein